MSERRKTASFLLRVWQEPSEWQPPGEWRISVRPLQGGGETLFKSAAELWNYLINEDTPSQTVTLARLPKLKGDEEK
ncbi:MAG: hypothetical protein HZB18_11735 [Chloroflexi bacterium]|nr:hypothetical protein [Chloroflexota bacterium]